MLYSIDYEGIAESSRIVSPRLIYSSPTDIEDFFILKKINKIAFFNNKIILINKDGTINVEINFETEEVKDIGELLIEGYKIVIITFDDVYVYNYNSAKSTINLYYDELQNFMYSEKMQVVGEFVFVSSIGGDIKKYLISDFYQDVEQPLLKYDKYSNALHDFKLLSTNEIVGTYTNHSDSKNYLVSWLNKKINMENQNRFQ